MFPPVPSVFPKLRKAFFETRAKTHFTCCKSAPHLHSIISSAKTEVPENAPLVSSSRNFANSDNGLIFHAYLIAFCQEQKTTFFLLRWPKCSRRRHHLFKRRHFYGVQEVGIHLQNTIALMECITAGNLHCSVDAAVHCEIMPQLHSKNFYLEQQKLFYYCRFRISTKVKPCCSSNSDRNKL